MLDLTPSGLEGLRSALAAMESRADDATPALDAIGEDIRDVLDEGFETAGSSTGRRWKPLARGYLKSRLAKGKGTTILEVSGSRGGVLRKSYAGKRKDGIYDLRTRSVDVGTRAGIASLHQRGGTAAMKWPSGRTKSYKVPARPHLPQADVLRTRRYDEVVGAWIVDGVVKEPRGL